MWNEEGSVRHLVGRLGDPAGLRCCYEAGPCGFELHRLLASYTHRLLPSGTLANPDARLLIGPGATLYIPQLLTEIAQCGVEAGGLFIDPQAMIIEDADMSAEKNLVTGIGSTGKGGGAAAARRIMGRYGADPPVRLARDLPELSAYVRPAADVLDEAYRNGHRILLEGAQGTALSTFHGSYPHVTSRDTTTAGCLAEAGIAWSRVNRVIMVCRTYPIRVMSPADSTSGPMKQELTWDVIAYRSGVPLNQRPAQESLWTLPQHSQPEAGGEASGRRRHG